MSTNMELIEAKTLGSNTSGVTFSSIPQTYTDLKLVYSARNTTSAAGEGYDATISFNGTTANRVTRVLRGDGSGVAVNTISDPTDFRLLRSIQPSDYTSSIFSNVEIYLPNYTSSDYKLFSVDTVLENNATATGLGIIAGQWSDTAAITSITLGGTGGNLLSGSTFYLYGITNVTSTTKATGGIVSSDGTYNYHMFPFSGTFTPTAAITVDYLVIAGGGGGAGNQGGGGGAGGLRSTVGTTGGGGSLESALSLTANTAYTVTVGAGGSGTWGSTTNGSNSVFSTITSTGGGKGGSGGVNGSSGGSGGGGGYAGSPPVGTGGAGTANQGYAGGDGVLNQYGGSGGGAGGAGTAGNNASITGGAGVQITAFANATQTGINSGYYAIGGNNNGSGNGTVNTGNGAQANQNNGANNGGSGGSGLVIIRYAI